MVQDLQRQQQPADGGLRQATREPTGAAFQMDTRELGDYLTLRDRRLAKAVFYHAVLDAQGAGMEKARNHEILQISDCG